MPEPSAASAWRVERYRDGDELEVLGLFRTVFGKARSLEHWVWQFKSNPYGGPFASVARRASDGAVVGSYSVMPMMLNVMGRPVPACQSVDTAVHPDHRGQRMFEATASDCYAWCANEKLMAVIGFPNANSYPGFVRTLAWKRIVFPTQYVLRLSVNAALRKAAGLPMLPGIADAFYRGWRGARLDTRRAMLNRLGSRGLAFQMHDAVPNGYEALWNAWRSQEVLSVWKDAAYLSWRYDRNPDQRFTYFTLARGAEMVALAVGVVIDDALVLCELMVKDRDVVAGRRLATEIALEALARGRKAVSFLGADQGFFAEALQGFERQTSFGNVFCGRSFDSGQLAELLPYAGNWTVTFGDGDFV